MNIPRHLMHMVRFAVATCFVCLSGALSNGTVGQASEADNLFENKIRPVLVQSCLRCHGSQRTEGALRVDSREALLAGGDSGPALVVSQVDESLLIRAISRHPDVSAMPPEKDKALRPDQIEDFRQWIKSGADWPASSPKFETSKHWAFDPTVKIEPPIPRDPAWASNAVDRFIRSAQESANVSPARQADKLSLIRRATFDLTGLPPTAEEVSAFMLDDSEAAFSKVVDRLLDTQAYGEKWGRHWLDVVRYADTAGETADYPVPTAWKYRDYVIKSFNSDKPYDEFLREQIAGDIFANQSQSADDFAEKTIATGYLAISRRFGFDSENYHHLTIQDTIDTVGQSVLGLNLGCSRCHDSKFDPVPMSDYYALYGIFDSSRYPFPGSEQKQRMRCLVPLARSSASRPMFREFESKLASLSSELTSLKQPVPQASLRSLHDMDGDFEIQAPAAGGSNGVLVPPWLYHGKIAVTNSAQSPFQNLYPRGKVGASIPAGTDPYRIEQSLFSYQDKESLDELFVNLDFKVAGFAPNQLGQHRLWIGRVPVATLLQVMIQGDTVQLLSGDSVDRTKGTRKENAIASSAKIEAGQWYNLQLHLDFGKRIISGTLSTTSSRQVLDGIPMPKEWRGVPDRVALDSIQPNNEAIASIDFDNLSVQVAPIRPTTVELDIPERSISATQLGDLQAEIKTTVGFDGSFEFQTDGEAPSEPWGPGPNSVVKILSRAQSSFTNLFSAGELGLHMPNRGEYDGFGRYLPKTWKSEETSQLYTTFDFRCASQEKGGTGSWRYYVGHGPGPSPAVELFFNGEQFFQRNADAREPVCQLVIGDWYQVRLALDLKARTYRGSIVSNQLHQEFEGAFAPQWDGQIDYTFIDSYGHVGGVRPALDVDNYEIRETEFSDTASAATPEEMLALAEKRKRVSDLRRELKSIQGRGEALQTELQKLLAQGPVPMAYAMAEGTPHSVRIQKRGEPDQLGAEVPRGFISVLGGNDQASHSEGSGRLELSNWLASESNPLTARVMVNRIWLYHFGEGLVKTPNDFGARGLPPTNPALLDYLANYFVEHKWSIKQMHRLIMNSQTYQQSTEPSVSTDADGPNVADLYTHFLRRRLSAEEIRDSILYVSGSLDRVSSTEHPFPSPTSWGFSQHGPFLAVYENDRRSVYLMTQRIKRHPFLALFDGPDPNASTPKRLSTTVPTQALFFLNDPFVHSKADTIAMAVLKEFDNLDDRVNGVYRTLFGRLPSSTELADAKEFLSGYLAEIESNKTGEANSQSERLAINALVRTLFGSNEFLYVD